MKLQDQVCTLDQAKRLKELGICQDSLFVHDEIPFLPGDSVIRLRETPTHDYSGNPAAFTVAELGMMIGRGTNAAALFYDAVQDRMNRSHSFTIALDVKFVANCVIGLLETGRLTIAGINERLKSA